MTNDDIIRMALDAGIRDSMEYPHMECDLQSLERFADLIEQHLFYDNIHTCHAECQRSSCVAVREAVKAEREACAQLCESKYDYYGHDHIFAAAIRARGEK